MRLVLAPALMAIAALPARAASIPDWPTKCAILRSAADRAASLPSPYASGEFSLPPNDVFKTMPGMAERIGTPTPNLTDFLSWPNKNCGAKDSGQQGAKLFFGEPLVDFDFAAVDLEQDQDLARNRTRMVLKRADSEWVVVAVLTYEGHRSQPLQIVWPTAPRSSHLSSARERPSSPGS